MCGQVIELVLCVRITLGERSRAGTLALPLDTWCLLPWTPQGVACPWRPWPPQRQSWERARRLAVRFRQDFLVEEPCPGNRPLVTGEQRGEFSVAPEPACCPWAHSSFSSPSHFLDHMGS